MAGNSHTTVKCKIDSWLPFIATIFLFTIFLWINHFTISKNSFINTEIRSDLCSGRYIYIHDLPSRFNSDIIKNCSSLIKGFGDMCPCVSNMGLGPQVEQAHGVLQGNIWYLTNQFMLEIIFHNRMKHYKCITSDSSLASAIYVPFYAGLDVGRYLWGFDTSARDSNPENLMDWLIEKPEWKFMNGTDHFLAVGRTTWDFRRQTDDFSDWGNKLIVSPRSRNMTFLIIESCPWCNNNDIAVPYPTFFHPENDQEIHEWQDRVRRERRPYLYSFIGAPRPKRNDSIRFEIIEQCLASMDNCKWLNCTYTDNCEDPYNVIGVFQSSKFCLQPPGDTPTRRSTFDSILAGCIPVFFHKDSAYTQYLLHLPENYTKYSVLISENDVKNGNISIEETLLKISEEDEVAMREEVVRLIPRVSYANPLARLEDFEDAFDVAISGVIDKVNKARRAMEENAQDQG